MHFNLCYNDSRKKRGINVFCCLMNTDVSACWILHCHAAYEYQKKIDYSISPLDVALGGIYVNAVNNQFTTRQLSAVARKD